MPDNQVDEIKGRLDVAELIRGYMKLEKSGVNLRGLCPFHREKTPSFFVSPSRQLWKCFGCGVGGDMFTFIEQIEGVDFKEALQVLADKAGVQLKSYDPKVRSEKSRLYEICEKACQFFEKQLAATSLGQEARAYLLDRGISDESIKKFRLGFAPNSYDALCSFLCIQGYSPSEIFKSGVSVQGARGGFDRFHGRIIFPILDINSQIIGFGGRIFFAKNQVPDKSLAKYINTPQTLLYDKSKVLYGIDKAKQKIRESEKCILMEGYTDVIMAHQAGSENAVSVSGTALTEQQLDLVRRFTDNIVSSFDMDIAGDSATKRGIEMAQRKGFNIKVILLPEGKDPAEFIQKKPDNWREYAEGAMSIGDFYFSTAFGKFDKKTPEGIRQISAMLLPVIKNIPMQIEQSFWVQKLAAMFNCAENIIWRDLEKIVVSLPENSASEKPDTKKVPVPQKSKEDMLYEHLLLFLQREPHCADLVVKEDLKLLYSAKPMAVLFTKTLNKDRYLPEEKALLDSILFQNEIFPLFDESTDFAAEFKNCLSALRQIALRGKLFKLQAELKNNPSDEKILKQFQKMSIRLAKN